MSFSGGGQGYVNVSVPLNQAVADLLANGRYNPPVIDGQTTFTLPSLPLNAATVALWVNGIVYRSPTIVVSGTSITWGGTFPLSATDFIHFTYI